MESPRSRSPAPQSPGSSVHLPPISPINSPGYSSARSSPSPTSPPPLTRKLSTTIDVKNCFDSHHISTAQIMERNSRVLRNLEELAQKRGQMFASLQHANLLLRPTPPTPGRKTLRLGERRLARPAFGLHDFLCPVAR